MSTNRFNIPPESAVAVQVPQYGRVRIVNTEGGQVVDTWAFNLQDFHEYLSMEHSRSATYHVLFQPDDRLVSNRFRPMLTIIQDTSPGYHDTLHAACSSASNRYYGVNHDRPNCQDNLRQALAQRKFPLATVPCPWNLFERADIVDGYRLQDIPSSAAPGDFVEIEAAMDLLLVCSACPSTVGDISAGPPRGALIEFVDVALDTPGG